MLSDSRACVEFCECCGHPMPEDCIGECAGCREAHPGVWFSGTYRSSDLSRNRILHSVFATAAGVVAFNATDAAQ